MSEFAAGLYVVATPIGNLGDLSPRASAVLAAAHTVAAEDTRTSATILRRAKSAARLVSLTEHNVLQRTPGLLALAGEQVVALVSDAGTPIVADPGARLVEAAHAAGVAVRVVPGPSALTAALSASGMSGSDVRFLGFLPRQRGERLRRLAEAARTAPVLVVFESPARVDQTLRELCELLNDPVVAVCRELTKLHEETARGLASELAVRFEHARGECTLVVEVPRAAEGDDAAVHDYMAEMQRAGARRAPAAAEAARRFGISREAAYAAWPAQRGT